MNINKVDEIVNNTSENMNNISDEILKNNAKDIKYDYDYDSLNEEINMKFIIPSVNYYNDYKTNIKFMKNGKITKLNCNCQTYKFSKMCEHILVATKIANSNKKTIFKNLNVEEQNESNPLIETMRKNKRVKQKIYFELTLSKESIRSEKGYYEVRIQIGNENKYVLKKYINDFFESYYSKEGVVAFGKNFIYNPKIHYFSEDDKKIIELLPLILTQKYNYGNNIYSIDNNYLSTYSYKSKILFDKLREIRKNFILELDGVSYEIKHISDEYNPKIYIDSTNENISINFDISKILPLTDDYSYIFDGHNVYYLNEEKASVVKSFLENDERNFTKGEEKDFNEIVLPNIRRITKNINFSKNIVEKYNSEKSTIKLFFDRYEDGINCVIKAYYNDIEINVLDNKNTFNDITIIRDLTSEEEAKEFIKEYGFYENKEENNFVLTDEDYIIDFIDYRLSSITKYDIFVTDNLKNIKYISKPIIKSSFSLERGELLKCNISIDGISNDELEDIMNSIKYKRKYYKLKNGSYLNLTNNDELNALDNMLSSLNIEYKELENDEIRIPKYKALYINNKINKNDFIEVSSSFEKFIDTYKKSISKSYDIEQPQGITLRDYQELGIKWLSTLAEIGFGGILADEMGLGKTLQTIMFIKQRLKADSSRNFLIVCPTSLIYNWESEFKKYAPNIRVKVIADLRKKREKVFDELQNYEVFITSYGLLREDIEKYKNIEYDTFIIDEAQTIKNVNALITKAVKQINASTRIALTGTPIENSILELYSIFDFVMPGFFGTVNNFQKKYNGILKDVNDPIKQEFLSLINPFILRRKKKDVIKELPDKIENNILVDLCDEQKKLYLSEVKKITQDIKNNMRNNTFSKNKLVILQELTRLRQLCIAPSLCINDYNGKNSKIDTAIELIENAISEGHKILIFSQFTSALTILKKELTKLKINYYYLDGSTKSAERIKMVNEFNENNISVFLISLKAGGNGLNLTGADIVIHLDPWWNPAVEDQATDRAHRIGQKNVVQVMKLIAKGTIEEKIVKLQNLKKDLSNQIVEGKDRDKFVLGTLNEDDLLYLLENE